MKRQKAAALGSFLAVAPYSALSLYPLQHAGRHYLEEKTYCTVVVQEPMEERAMRMQEFIRLPQKAKVTLLYEQGVYVGKRHHGKTIAVLYQLEGFYAEVFYRVYRREINRISCFSKTARLDPYLAGIDVEQLVM